MAFSPQTGLAYVPAQEVAMAKWVLDHLPGTTNAFLTRSATPGLEAKV